MNHRHIALVAVLFAALTLSGCGRDASDGSLDAQPASPSPACLVHQTEEPGDQYTRDSGADTGSVLEMMRYYTANGTKPYCDGKGPTGTDRSWTDLYSRLGGARDHIAGGDAKRR